MFTGANVNSISFACVQELLLAYGEYPAKYRLLVWDFLLRLPHNSEAFQVRPLAYAIIRCRHNMPSQHAITACLHSMPS